MNQLGQTLFLYFPVRGLKYLEVYLSSINILSEWCPRGLELGTLSINSLGDLSTLHNLEPHNIHPESLTAHSVYDHSTITLRPPSFIFTLTYLHPTQKTLILLSGMLVFTPFEVKVPMGFPSASACGRQSHILWTHREVFAAMYLHSSYPN